MIQMPNPDRPMPFVKRVWEQQAALVEKFKLESQLGGVVGGFGSPGDSWLVWVTCGVLDPNAKELAAAIDFLQREIESVSGLDITLMLMPRDQTQTQPA